MRVLHSEVMNLVIMREEVLEKGCVLDLNIFENS